MTVRAFNAAPPDTIRPAPFVENGARDVDHLIDRLPPAARDKMARLRALKDDLYALNFRAYEQELELRTSKREAEQEVNDLEAADRQGRLVRQTVEPGFNQHGRQDITLTRDVPRLDAARTKAHRLAEQYEAKRQLHEDRKERWNNLSNLLARVERWLPSLPATIEPHKAEAVSPRRGEAIVDAVDRVRGTIRTLTADLDAVKAAPIPSKDAKARIRAHVASLAETGTPDLFALIERGALDIRYPQMPIALNISGKASASGDSVLGRAMGTIMDPIALLAWMDRDRLSAAYEAEIDRCADDAAALDDKTRAKRSTELEAAILDAGYVEEALIEQSEQAGINMPRRLEADPRAVLALSPSLPGPRE